MQNKILGIIIIVIAIYIAVDTIIDINTRGIQFFDIVILAVSVLVGVRGILRLIKTS